LVGVHAAGTHPASLGRVDATEPYSLTVDFDGVAIDHRCDAGDLGAALSLGLFRSAAAD
jgi:hypothetical protein